MSGTVSPTLAGILRSARGELNARFVEARIRHPDLDADGFAEFLCVAVDPLVESVARARPERATDVALVAYDVGLELVGQKLVGPMARWPHVDGAWRRILPPVGELVAADPQRIIAAVCNAANQLATTQGVRPTEWIDAMARLGPQCPDPETFLKVGQVAAWRAGMAHLRRGALAVADALPESLVAAALGAPSMRWAEARERLRADPWFDPVAPPTTANAPRVVARAGAFRGFGGLFVEPPVAAAADDLVFVRSGADCWILEADAFGSTFHRVTPQEFEQASARSTLPSGIALHGATLRIRGVDAAASGIVGDVTSACGNHTTLVVTSSMSHAVVLFSLPSS